jgi:hypothetical protein
MVPIRWVMGTGSGRNTARCSGRSEIVTPTYCDRTAQKQPPLDRFGRSTYATDNKITLALSPFQPDLG